ncbi:hypothetical protein OG225_40860 (plasmid) [Nocardia sp. NBC_01377]|uniref:hypothetical protein n=1 Tax=Nocardia sp. NBC_01377 TaxID=2903595 RepID=UPI002F907C5B
MRPDDGAGEEGVEPPWTVTDLDRDLADRLFTAGEFWGFEYTPPRPPMPHPSAGSPPDRPVLQVPFSLRTAEHRARGAWGFAACVFAVSWLPMVVVGVGVNAGLGVLTWLGCLGVAVAYVVWTSNLLGRARGEFALVQRRADAIHDHHVARWRAAIAHHNRCEDERFETAMRWRPVTPRSRTRRLDVFGGTVDGWTSLLATMGSSVLGTDAGMLVLDFTEHEVAHDLVRFAAIRACPVTVVELPMDTARIGLLAGLSAAEAAEVIAEAAAIRRGLSEHAADLHDIDAALLTKIAGRLDAPLTLTRLDAAVRAIRGFYETSELVLSAQELHSLRVVTDKITATPRATEALESIGSLLDLVKVDESATTTHGAAQIWPSEGLAVVTTGSPHPRRKNALDRIVLARVLHELRAGRSRTNDVIVVAGADQLGLPALETLSHYASRCGVRLVLMLQHLRDDMIKLLGTGESSTILMRLGNATEAAAGADLIGRGHKFVLSQQSVQTGQTTSTGRTVGTTHGDTSSSNYSSSESVADSVNSGTTVQLMYIYTVEPTTLQSLPITAFVLVDADQESRVVAAADSNPGIALLDKVAGFPPGITAAGGRGEISPAAAPITPIPSAVPITPTVLPPTWPQEQPTPQYKPQ